MRTYKPELSHIGESKKYTEPLQPRVVLHQLDIEPEAFMLFR